MCTMNSLATTTTNVTNKPQGQWGKENHKEPVRKIRAALEFDFPQLFILSTPDRGVGLTISYPQHVTLQSQHCRNIIET